MTEAHGKMYFGGVPTEPDVQRLIDGFGTPQAGLILHEEIEEAIGERRSTSRYRTVVHAWRRRLLNESNVQTRAEPGVGIRVLREDERVDEQFRQYRGTTRRAVRVHNDTLRINAAKLDDLTRRKYDHTIRATAAVASVAVSTTKQLVSELRPLKQLPAASPAERGE